MMLMVVASMLALAAAEPAAEPVAPIAPVAPIDVDEDGLRASSFVAGERVLLVSDALDSPLALRTRDELESMGLFVVLRDDDDILEVVSSGRALGAAAAVEVHGGRLDLWADLLVEEGRVAHAVIVRGDEPVEVVALRAAELVRARILRPQKQRVSSTATPMVVPTPIAIAPATPMMLEGAVGAQVLQAVGDVQPMVRVVVGGSVAVEQVVFGVGVAIPTVPANVVAAQGSADLQLTGLCGEVGWRFAPTEHINITPHVRFGGTWIHGVGRSAVDTVARTGDLVVGEASVGVRADWVVQGPLVVWLNAEGGAFASQPVIGVGNADVPLGPAVGSIAAGVAVRFGGSL
jgi:hypothetical protein